LKVILGERNVNQPCVRLVVGRGDKLLDDRTSAVGIVTVDEGDPVRWGSAGPRKEDGLALNDVGQRVDGQALSEGGGGQGGNGGNGESELHGWL